MVGWIQSLDLDFGVALDSRQTRNDVMWHRMMAIAFFTNGLGVFGTRILAGWSWADQYKFQYLAFWYGAGCMLALLLYLRNGLKVQWKELVIGASMAAVSVGGQLSLLTALEKGVPGHVAFPMANGGGLFLVALVGILTFGERVHHYGVAGIVLGIVATALLSVP